MQSRCKRITLIFGIKRIKGSQQNMCYERMKMENQRYGFISTGNFNEATVKFILM
jgi:polyphosphate kinase